MRPSRRLHEYVCLCVRVLCARLFYRALFVSILLSFFGERDREMQRDGRAQIIQVYGERNCNSSPGVCPGSRALLLTDKVAVDLRVQFSPQFITPQVSPYEEESARRVLTFTSICSGSKYSPPKAVLMLCTPLNPGRSNFGRALLRLRPLTRARVVPVTRLT